MNHRVLAVLLSLCSPGLLAEDIHTSAGKEMPGIRLVGGASHCSGTAEIKMKGNWTPANNQYRDLTTAAEVCRQLDCGSIVSLWRTQGRPINIFGSVHNLQSEHSSTVKITCSESVRLVNGTNLCSGRLEVKSNQSWSPVCGDDFDRQDAEVVCRELGCGPPPVFHSVLYVDVAEDPVWTKEFRCRGNESVLLDCDSSGPARKSCPSGKAVVLTCADPDDVRLVGGANNCTGRLELKHQGDWKAVDHFDVLMNLNMICGWLGCGSTVSIERTESRTKPVWHLTSSCVQSKYTLRECVKMMAESSRYHLEITCTESVRLVNGTNLCSGRLEVKSNQSWSPVCGDDFDRQDAEVVCRELGCGVPSAFHGALYGGVAPVWTEEFLCEGNESLLLDCGRSGPATKTCSPDTAVGLTCSDSHNVRLVGEPSSCAGTLEVKNQGEWRPAADYNSKWDRMSAATVCRQLDCGSVVSTTVTESYLERPVWWIKHSCVLSASALWDCVMLTGAVDTFVGLEVICSDLLTQPYISLSHSTDGGQDKQGAFQVLIGSNFTITCSVEPQYEGHSFQLIFTNSDRAQNYTLPAVNHSAHFLFSAADDTHEGDYRCVYYVHAFNHNFSSESPSLHLTISAPLTDLIVRHVVLLLGIMLLITAVCITSKISRKQKDKNSELGDQSVAGSSTEDWICGKAGGKRKISQLATHNHASLTDEVKRAGVAL